MSSSDSSSIPTTYTCERSSRISARHSGHLYVLTSAIFCRQLMQKECLHWHTILQLPTKLQMSYCSFENSSRQTGHSVPSSVTFCIQDDQLCEKPILTLIHFDIYGLTILRSLMKGSSTGQLVGLVKPIRN